MVAINVALPGAQRNSDLSEVARLRVILNATRGEICGYSIFFFFTIFLFLLNLPPGTIVSLNSQLPIRIR